MTAAAESLDAAGLLARFAARTEDPPARPWAETPLAPDAPGDHDLNPGTRYVGAPTPAAVLVPLVDRPQGLSVMLTRRTSHLAAHAGQISFPGGRAEPEDATPEATALRETEEEVGLAPQRVRLLGRLSLYVTVTGFAVVPVVGLVHPPFTLKPDPFEVADVFEVPLDFILDPANHQRHQRQTDHGLRRHYAIPYQDHYIWGATAGMLVDLWSVLKG